MLSPDINLISITVCLLITPILKPFETSVNGEIQRRTVKEFKNISSINTLIATPTLLKKHIAADNKFHYVINENNLKDNAKPSEASINDVKSPSLPDTLTPTPSSTSSEYFERVEFEESLRKARDDKLLLHRNKRYLLFPDGTSFQLVFDLIIPIVDYTNYAIMGITCAVAWELPSKPPSEIIENFQHKLNEGTFGLSRRNDSTQQLLKYINSQQIVQDEGDNKSKQQKQQQLSATVATTSAHENFITNERIRPPLLPANNFYYNNIQHEEHRLTSSPPSATRFFYNKHSPHIKWHNYDLGTGDNYQTKTFPGSGNRGPMYRQHQQMKQTKPMYNNAADFWSKNNWWERNKNRIEQQWHETQQKWSPYEKKQTFSTSQQNSHTPNMFSQRTGRNRKILKKPPKHRIYPVFGKRRKRSSSFYRNSPHYTVIDNDEFSQKLELIHTREHLHSRQKLYKKIEKLYKTRGHNGTACVLLALCETQKVHLNNRYNPTPQSFVMELLRTIFALPKDTLTNAKDPLLHIDARYSDAVIGAHDDMSQSCREQFDGCEYGISYDMQI